MSETKFRQVAIETFAPGTTHDGRILEATTEITHPDGRREFVVETIKPVTPEMRAAAAQAAADEPAEPKPH